MTKSYRITGRLRDEGNAAQQGFVVQAFDKDRGAYLHPDDRLGKATTHEDGSFQIDFTDAAFKDWFESEPNIYLQVRDETGKVAVSTANNKNVTGRVDFQIKLGNPQVNQLEPDIYKHNLERMTASLRDVGDAIDLSRDDVRNIFELLLGVLGAWTTYRDDLVRLCGYDGIQVPEQPRKQEHHHITRWDEAVLPL